MPTFGVLRSGARRTLGPTVSDVSSVVTDAVLLSRTNPESECVRVCTNTSHAETLDPFLIRSVRSRDL